MCAAKCGAMIMCIIAFSLHCADATDGDAAFWPNAAESASALGSSATLPLLASHFQDHMVLQRGGNGAVVWGFAAAGTKVSVTFANAPYAAIADATGTWRVRLAPLAAGGPYTLEVTAGSVSATADDVLMGDVYM